MKHETDTANILSAITATFFGGCAIGSLAQCFVSDWVGRRGALSISATLALIGSALVAGSVNITMLFVMRVIQGIGLGMMLALVPLYLTEVAPPKHRGFLTGSTQFSTGIGYIMYADKLPRLPLESTC
jgi:MFS family permease